MVSNSDIEAQAEQILAGIMLSEEQSLLQSGLLYSIVATSGVVRVMIDDDVHDLPQIMDSNLPSLVEQELMQIDGVVRVVVKPKPKSICIGAPIAGVKHVVAVHSVKGGVGKSTVTAHLALALARAGLKVGLLDADVYGPSVPLMFAINEDAEVDELSNKMKPMEKEGLKLMSVGMMLPDDAPLLWRGNLVDEGIPQLFAEVQWGELDLLLIDMPPGTGDVPIAIARHVPLDGVLTITSASSLSVVDVRRGIEFFADVKVPLLGIIENMGVYQCDCGEAIALFGAAGGTALAQELGLDLLAQLPFAPEVVAAAEQEGGVAAMPAQGFTRAMDQLGAQLASKLQINLHKETLH